MCFRFHGPGRRHNPSQRHWGSLHLRGLIPRREFPAASFRTFPAIYGEPRAQHQQLPVLRNIRQMQSSGRETHGFWEVGIGGNGRQGDRAGGWV